MYTPHALSKTRLVCTLQGGGTQKNMSLKLTTSAVWVLARSCYSILQVALVIYSDLIMSGAKGQAPAGKSVRPLICQTCGAPLLEKGATCLECGMQAAEGISQETIGFLWPNRHMSDHCHHHHHHHHHHQMMMMLMRLMAMMMLKMVMNDDDDECSPYVEQGTMCLHT